MVVKYDDRYFDNGRWISTISGITLTEEDSEINPARIAYYMDTIDDSITKAMRWHLELCHRDDSDQLYDNRCIHINTWYKIVAINIVVFVILTILTTVFLYTQ